MKRNSVGALRQQSALCDADRPIVLVSSDPLVQALLNQLEVVRVYPDTTDQNRSFDNGGTFKIEVSKRS